MLFRSDTSNNLTRYQLLNVTRAFALEKLSQSEDFLDVHRRHCEYIHRLLGHAKTNRDMTGRLGWDETFDFLIADIRAALDWALSPTGDPVLAAEITVASIPFGFKLGLVDELRGRAEQALVLLERLSSRQPVVESRLRAALTKMSLSQPEEPMESKSATP